MPKKQPDIQNLADELISRLPQPVWVLQWESPPDLGSFRIVAANPAAGTDLGFPIASVLGTTIAESFPDLLTTGIPAAFMETITSGAPVRLRRVRYSDERIPDRVLDLNIFPLGGQSIGVITDDITTRWADEERLRLEEGLLAQAGRLAHVGTFRYDARTSRMTWSEEVYRIFGLTVDEFDGTLEGFFQQIHDDDRDRARSCINEAFTSREACRLRARTKRMNGSAHVIELVWLVDQDEGGQTTGMHGVCVDITERKKTDHEPISDEPFRMLVDRVRDYAIFMLDPGGRVVTWNEGAQRIKGYTREEIVGQHISRFYTPEDVERGRPAVLLAAAEKDGRVEEEGWRVRKDGTRFWADVIITALRGDDGELRGFAKVTRDLTERRESELALAELSGRLLQMQDDERRRIARELHDSTSPLLTGLVAKLYNARQRAKGKDDQLTALLDDALTNAEATTTVLRSVTSLLHPPLLDESGLAASIKWYANAFAGRNSIQVDLEFPPRLERLDRDIEIALFRFVQEGFANVILNLGMKRVKVSMHSDGEIVIEIRGEGRDAPAGLLSDLRMSRGDVGIGIAGMRERLRKLGGKVDVSTTGGGITITGTIPRPHPKEEQRRARA